MQENPFTGIKKIFEFLERPIHNWSELCVGILKPSKKKTAFQHNQSYSKMKNKSKKYL